MKTKFSTKHDSLFPKQFMFIGILLCISVVGAPLGILMLCADQGASFDPEEKRFRNYTGIFGLKFGKWESYQNYPDLALLSRRLTSSSYSDSNRRTGQTEQVYELQLLSSDHRKKILVYVYKNRNAAEQTNPELLAQNLGVNFTTYSPKISTKTAARRRR